MEQEAGKLLVIAYPELSDEDFSRIEIHRQQNDKYYKVVRPHFTLVFPLTVNNNDLIAEIGKLLRGCPPVRFRLQKAFTHKDAFEECYHVFLVPEEGYEEIKKLHDILYSGALAKHLRHDIEYVPHITIGNSTDPMICKQMIDAWNHEALLVHGILSVVDIAKYNGSKVITLEKIKLLSVLSC